MMILGIVFAGCLIVLSVLVLIFTDETDVIVPKDKGVGLCWRKP